MNLNKTQIQALATKFYNEISAKIDKENAINFKSKLETFRADYNKGIKILDKNPFIKNIDINIDSTHIAELKRNMTFEHYSTNYNFKYVIKDKKEIKKSDIESDIILATIDSQSVEDIMKVLTNKYK